MEACFCERHQNLSRVGCPVCAACQVCDISNARAVLNAHLGDYRGALGAALEDNRKLAELVYDAIGLMERVTKMFKIATTLVDDESLKKLLEWKENGGCGRQVG
jgi:hypothetical protein